MADADTKVTGVVITGAGDVLCSGLDIPAIQAGGDPVEFATALVALLKLIPTAPPVVAVVNGNAVASGAGVGIWSMVARCRQ